MKITIDNEIREMTAEELLELENTRKDFYNQNLIVIKNEIRSKRDDLLLKSDWTQLPNAQVSDPQSWEVYRQALRDIPQQEGFSENINWPVAPGA